jgi:hypothetical protein
MAIGRSRLSKQDMIRRLTAALKLLGVKNADELDDSGVMTPAFKAAVAEIKAEDGEWRANAFLHEYAFCAYLEDGGAINHTGTLDLYYYGWKLTDEDGKAIDDDACLTSSMGGLLDYVLKDMEKEKV